MDATGGYLGSQQPDKQAGYIVRIIKGRGGGTLRAGLAACSRQSEADGLSRFRLRAGIPGSVGGFIGSAAAFLVGVVQHRPGAAEGAGHDVAVDPVGGLDAAVPEPR